jgi:hypothetical protein
MVNGLEASQEEMDAWNNGGFRGRAPAIEYGIGKGFRVKDLWCSVWYTRFIGSRRECNAWIDAKRKEEMPFLNVDYQIEKLESKEVSV